MPLQTTPFGLTAPTVPFTTITSKEQKAVEPAVIASKDQTQITDISTKLNDFLKAGYSYDAHGILRDASGAIVPGVPQLEKGEPMGAKSGEPGTWKTNPTTGIVEFIPQKQTSDTEFKIPEPTEDPIYKQNIELIQQQKSQFDAASLGLINSIHSQYENLISQQKEINRRAEAGRQQALLIAGSARYAPFSSEGIMHEQMSYGLQQIADLTAREQSEVAKAVSAQADKDWQLVEKQVNLAETARKEKQELMKKQAENILEMNKKAREARVQADKDLAIASIVTPKTGTPITDPTQILSTLKAQGRKDVTIKDISNYFDAITKSTGIGIDKLTGEVKNFYELKRIAKLPNSISQLPEEQQLQAYLSMVKTSERAPTIRNVPGIGLVNVKPDGSFNVVIPSSASDNKVLSVADAEKLGVPYGTTAKEARGITPSQLTASTKTMIQAAPTVINFADKIIKQVNDAEKGLGPVASRWREFKAGKVGLSDPAFTKIRTDVGLLSTALMRMHVGARGGEAIMEHFKNLIDSGKQSPDNLKASLGEIKDYANFLLSEQGPAPQFTSDIHAGIKLPQGTESKGKTYQGVILPK